MSAPYSFQPSQTLFAIDCTPSLHRQAVAGSCNKYSIAYGSSLDLSVQGADVWVELDAPGAGCVLWFTGQIAQLLPGTRLDMGDPDHPPFYHSFHFPRRVAKGERTGHTLLRHRSNLFDIGVDDIEASQEGSNGRPVDPVAFAGHDKRNDHRVDILPCSR